MGVPAGGMELFAEEGSSAMLAVTMFCAPMRELRNVEVWRDEIEDLINCRE